MPALGRAFTHARHGIGQAPQTIHSMFQTLDLAHNSLQAKLPRRRKKRCEDARTPKHFVRNAKKCDPHFAKARQRTSPFEWRTFGVRTRPRVAFVFHAAASAPAA